MLDLPVPQRTGTAAALSQALPDPARTPFAHPVPHRRRPTWTRQYALGLVMVDTGLVLVGVIVAFVLRFGLFGDAGTTPHTYLVVSVLLVLGWVAALAAVGAYEARHFTTGNEEFKRLVLGTGVTAGVIAIVCYVFRLEIARGFVIGAIPVGLVLLLVGRMAFRQLVRTWRDSGEWCYRILVAGTRASVVHFVEMTRRAPGAGMQVVGACVEDAEIGEVIGEDLVVRGGVTEVAAIAELIDADVVALSGAGIGPATIRHLGWSLEGTGRDLMMVPGLTEVAGPRVHVTPVEGLPLMWVDKPVLRGYKRLLKRGVDVAVSGLLLVLLAPVLAVIGLLIRTDSPGPVFFRQERFGKAGAAFRIWKFRSMTDDAAARHADVVGDALFGKVRADPRVTRVGRVLRKLSLDELPQLLNVLTGTMSLVGPRPQCDHEVAAYDDATSRRLMVKPGMTGLWQVSGRSDLTADDGVRLDLYYVENWSLALDVAILLRTVNAVVRGHGAY